MTLVQGLRYEDSDTKTQIQRLWYEDTDERTQIRGHWYEDSDTRTKIRGLWYEDSDTRTQVRGYRYKDTDTLQIRLQSLFDMLRQMFTSIKVVTFLWCIWKNFWVPYKFPFASNMRIFPKKSILKKEPCIMLKVPDGNYFFLNRIQKLVGFQD